MKGMIVKLTERRRGYDPCKGYQDSGHTFEGLLVIEHGILLVPPYGMLSAEVLSVTVGCDSATATLTYANAIGMSDTAEFRIIGTVDEVPEETVVMMARHLREREDFKVGFAHLLKVFSSWRDAGSAKDTPF